MDEHLAGAAVPGPVWAALGIAITSAVTLWRGRRADKLEMAKVKAEAAKSSGSIETSDAGEVWEQRGALFAEAERIRHELRDEVDRLRDELVEARGEISRLRSELTEARTDLVDCRTRISTLEPTVLDLTMRLRAQEEK